MTTCRFCGRHDARPHTRYPYTICPHKAHTYESGVGFDTAPEDVIGCCSFGRGHEIHQEQS
jgi:hypothetical protein